MGRVQIKRNSIRAAMGAALLLAAGPAFLVAARAAGQDKEPKSAADSPPQLRREIGETVILADELNYDFGARKYYLTGEVKVTSKQTRLTGDKMTIQVSETKELDWAKCEGNVFIEKKNPEDGSVATGRGRTLDYFDKEQKANLQGDVVVNQTSPRLAKPAIVTGSRVDMDLNTKVNVVFKSASEQAKVHIEPKGDEAKPGAPAKAASEKTAAGKPQARSAGASEPPEPMDLIGDRIEMNGATQEYVATGSPVLNRPSSKLQGKTIRFTVEKETNEVKKAYADDDVVFDSQSESGSVMHGTGDHGVYLKDANEVTLTGNVHATTKEPDDPAPSVYEGEQFTYNTVTRSYSLKRGKGAQATAVVPEKNQPPTKGKPQGGSAAPTSASGGGKAGGEDKKK